MKKILIILGVLLAFMFVVNAPADAAELVRSGFDALDTFVEGLTG